MKKMKLTAAALVSALALSVTACAKRTEDPTQADTTAQVADTTAQTADTTAQAADTTAADTTPSETEKEETSTAASTEEVTAAPTEEGTDAETGATIEYPTYDQREVVVPLDSIDVFDYVDFSEIDDLKIKTEDLAVSDAVVKYNINTALMSEYGYALEEVDRPVEGGDTVVIDYEGFIDGVAFDGGKDTDRELGIGSESFIPGFEDGIIGKKKGETFDVNVTFPEDYRATDLAGKPAVFKVTIKAVKALPTVTDAELDEKSAGLYPTFKAYSDEVEGEIRAYYHDSFIAKKILSAVKEKKQHEGLINEYVKQQYYRIDQMCAIYGIDRATYLENAGYTEAEVDTMLKENGAQYALQKLTILGICQKNEIKVEDSEIEALKKSLIEENKLENEEELFHYYTEDDIEYELLTEKFRLYISNYKTVD
ncbi:MAG: FKBP-type peptidyl-prolyl cis-trans isomerase [Lachnospiraceae bacterium]|nr:FKBP-type peptidyl-prolyl cis-trans isomerase [Lachnospiraceae bacterium]